MQHATRSGGVRGGSRFPRGLAVMLGLWLLAGGAVGRAGETVTFVFSSDVHFGLSRGKFRGEAVVPAPVVSAAMVATINALPAAVLPKDGGLRAGQPVGPLDFMVITGDLTNRQERLPLKIQSAAESWAQFENVFYGEHGLKLVNARGQPAPLLLVPGNHDVSNAIGHPNGLLPERDATTMVELYNRFMAPARPVTKEAYRYETGKIYYSRDFGGAHCIFLSIWPDSFARAWMEEDLKKVPAGTPVLLFAHDPPKGETKHFTNPRGKHDINAKDKFENVLTEVFKSGKDTDDAPEKEQRGFAEFLKRHRNIAAYFHGHDNWTDFHTWKGPDKDLALPAFRSDSPMKGRESGKDETKLAFQVVTYDAALGVLISRECLWNAKPERTGLAAIAWGEERTIPLRAK